MTTKKRPSESDFETYPLPICFDPMEERAALYKRRLKINNDLIQWQRENCKYALIDGYWKDDKTEFTGYLVKLSEENELQAQGKDGDEEIFHYFHGVESLEDAYEKKEACQQDFVVTNYKLLEPIEEKEEANG